MNSEKEKKAIERLRAFEPDDGYHLCCSGDNDESRRMVEMCYKTREKTVNPIVDWDDRDVWQFLYNYGGDSNPLCINVVLTV